MNTKKFISPGGWFSMEYPSSWSEFADEEGSFLFYNPDRWTGNFRISAFKDASHSYAEECMEDELKNNPSALKRQIGEWMCVYSEENFQENGADYATYLFVTGKGGLSIECSFTVEKGVSPQEAEDILQSLQIRSNGQQPKETIPIRVLEIEAVNEAYEWTSSIIKKLLKKDFTGEAKDIPHIQEVVDGTYFKSEQRDCWSAFGLTFGTILVNEMDGMNWVTVIDGKKEYPALQFSDTQVFINPNDLIWEKKHKNEKCDLKQEFERIKQEIEAVI